MAQLGTAPDFWANLESRSENRFPKGYLGSNPSLRAYNMKIKIKKDKYFKERGGKARIINVSCIKCGRLLFVYQKDGPHGWLKKCYLNRILKPEKYEKLQYKIKELKDLKKLICDCGITIGYPIKRKDGRLAYLLVRKTFKRTNYKEE